MSNRGAGCFRNIISDKRIILSVVLLGLYSAVVPYVFFYFYNVSNDYSSFFHIDSIRFHSIIGFYGSILRFFFFFSVFFVALYWYKKTGDVFKVVTVLSVLALFLYYFAAFEKAIYLEESQWGRIVSPGLIILGLLGAFFSGLSYIIRGSGKTAGVETIKEGVHLNFYIAALRIILFCFVFPLLLDFYILRSGSGFVDFLYENTINRYLFGYIVEFVIILSVFYFLSFFISKSWIVFSIEGGLMFLLAIGSRIKYENRNEIINIHDFKLTEVGGMISEYIKIGFSYYFFLLIFGFLCLLGLYLHFGNRLDPILFIRRKHHFSFKYIGGIVLCALCCALSLYFTKFIDNKLSTSVEKISFYSNHFVIGHFFSNGMASYTENDYKKALNYFDNVVDSRNSTNNVSGVRPNIIVLMNESWWDTNEIDFEKAKVRFSFDPMKNLTELQEKGATIGKVSVNTYGGGTVRSEAEFLMGLNLKYIRASDSIYNYVSSPKTFSVVDYFHSLGYHTCAMHPYYGWFYDRDLVYNYMDFDEIFFDESMQYREPFVKYISDSSLVQEIIDRYEKNEEESDETPVFMWNISIANHVNALPYSNECNDFFNYPIKLDFLTDELTAEDKEELIRYINGIYYSNQALAELISYFETVEQPTIILMFGDHCPDFNQKTLEILGFASNDDSLEKRKALYSTPVVFWSNYTNVSIKAQGCNINYLPVLLSDSAGLPRCEMLDILDYMNKQYTSDTIYYTLGNDGTEQTYINEEERNAIVSFNRLQNGLIKGSSLFENIWVGNP